MGVGSGEQGAVPFRIFMYDTDKVEGSLMMLFFGLVFSVASPPENFSADALGGTHFFLKCFWAPISFSVLMKSGW